MNSETLNLPHIHQHNAEYPRELYAAKVVNALLAQIKFPSHRVWVDLRFDYMLSEHSVSKIDVIQISGEAHGTVELRYQGLFLMQDFEAMVNEAVPHELAHVLHEIDAKINDFKVSKPHDDRWQDFFCTLAPNYEPLAKVKGNFDDRAIRLLRGGLPVRCECGGDEEFNVLADSTANATKLRNEELKCSACRFPYARAEADYPVPQRVQEDMKFLDQLRTVKLHHPALQR
jgi:predicted SprT family Zn-dependent metalloprotease